MFSSAAAEWRRTLRMIPASACGKVATTTDEAPTQVARPGNQLQSGPAHTIGIEAFISSAHLAEVPHWRGVARRVTFSFRRGT